MRDEDDGSAGCTSARSIIDDTKAMAAASSPGGGKSVRLPRTNISSVISAAPASSPSVISRILVSSSKAPPVLFAVDFSVRSEEHTSELQSLMRISYAVFCLKKKLHTNATTTANKN